MKKIIVTICVLLSLFCLTSCIREDDNKTENKKINLEDVTEIVVLKNAIINEGGIIASEYKATIELESNSYQLLNGLEYVEKEQYSGLSTYAYVLQIQTSDQITNIYVIDNSTFVYNNHRSLVKKGDFSFLTSLEYQDNSPVIYQKLDLTNVSEITVGKEVTINNDNTFTYKSTSTITLDSSAFTNLANVEYISNEEHTLATYAYVVILTKGEEVINIFIIDDNTFVYNGYECATNTNNFSFLNYLEYKTTSSSGSGWLPWV